MPFVRALILTLTCLAAHAGAANLAYSTYLKAGFTPKAITSDSQGNLYLAGAAVTDPLSGATAAAVAKLDSGASHVSYFVYLDGAVTDDLRAIAVDSSGNVYVTGGTANPQFPATGGKFASPPASRQDYRTFVTKLSPVGTVIFSVLVGGSTSSTAEAIALTPQGNILVSGVSGGSGFPTTPGAYSIADSAGHPFLLELDAAAANVVFSATGIGGSSLAVDAAGNIFVSGSTSLLDYPTTPGAYQTTFAPSFVCYGLCQIGFPGLQQYVSKVDPTGSRLIFSTGLNGATAYRSASTRNTGLAVDASGSVYLTGILDGGPYPFTTPPPTRAPYESGFLSKLDSSGSALLFSIPAGGGGVHLDSSGALYTAGNVTSFNPGVDPPSTAVAVPDPLASIPPQCLPDNVGAYSEAYVMKVDPGSGAVKDSQWVDGSALGNVVLTLAGGQAWIAGATQSADVPITPGAFTQPDLVSGPAPGAYLSAVDFSAASPLQIACVMDGGNLMHAGAVAPNQLLTLFGNNLTGSTVTFDGVPAEILYSSASQINLVVGSGVSKTTVMQVSSGASKAVRELPVVRSNPNLFADRPANNIDCLGARQGLALLAFNADGSRNSCSNPAKLGSVVSLYLHGVANPGCYCFDAAFGGRSVAVVNVTKLDNIVTRVDVQVPQSLDGAGVIRVRPPPVLGSLQVSMTLGPITVGPLPAPTGNITNATGALAIYATP